MAPKRKKNGRMKKGYLDFVHTGPGTLAGQYMRMFWQPVYRAQDLAVGQAKPIRAMGEDFTLYRGESGAPHVVAFRCAHRGTQLSVGWVEGDCIRCMYHGWKYDGTGQCVEQPAEEPSYARKIRIRSYPTEEYLGLIFAYFGEGKTPPLPRYPRFEKEGVNEVLPLQLSMWPCNYFQRLENQGDTVHVAFTHGATHLSANVRIGIPTISREESEWGLTSYASWPGGAINVYQLGMPNIFEFRLPSPYPELPWDDRLQWWVPVDDEHSVTFVVRLLPLTGDAAARHQQDSNAVKSNQGASVSELGEAVLAGRLSLYDLENRTNDKIVLVNAQDYVAQVGQGRIVDRGPEHPGRSDVGVILFRKVWERELRALAEGRPLKKWTHPAGMIPRFDPTGGKILTKDHA